MKKLIELVLVGTIIFGLVACRFTYSEVTNTVANKEIESICGDYFTIITSWGVADAYYVVYAKDTKVKYFVKWTGNQFGITPLYNADGTLQIYDENGDQEV